MNFHPHLHLLVSDGVFQRDGSLERFTYFDTHVIERLYFYASRLPGEPAEGIEDVHFHPAEPRTFRVLASWRR